MPRLHLPHDPVLVPAVEVRDRHAPGELAVQLHPDRRGRDPHEGGRHGAHQRDDVVHRRRREALLLTVGGCEEVQQIGDEAGRGGVERADTLADGVGGEGLVRDVQPDHRDPPGRAQHDRGGLRVRPHVEFRGRRDVSLRVPTAHEHHLAGQVGDAGLAAQGGRDVGLRPGGHQRDLAGVGEDRVDDDVHAVPGVLGERRRRQRRPVEAGGAVGAGVGGEFAEEGAMGTRGDDRVGGGAVVGRVGDTLDRKRGRCAAVGRGGAHACAGEARDRADGQGVAGHEAERLVPAHRGDGLDAHVRQAGGDEDGEGVVVAGVAVEDEAGRRGGRGHGSSVPPAVGP